MIVAGPDGLMKNAYRKFTIRGVAAARPFTTGQPSPPRARRALSRNAGEGRRRAGGGG